jgi:hypothetical protein
VEGQHLDDRRGQDRVGDGGAKVDVVIGDGGSGDRVYELQGGCGWAVLVALPDCKFCC